MMAREWMFRRCFGILSLLGLAISAPVFAQKTDAETLADNMPVVQLWPDTTLAVTYKPYFDCFVQAVGNGHGSMLEKDADVSEVSGRAQARCTEQKVSANIVADRHLAAIQPALPQQTRINLLAKYRRQMGFFALAEWYKSNGRYVEFQSYLERSGRSDKRGHVPVMLSAE
jgi:hypothetical protein